MGTWGIILKGEVKAVVCSFQMEAKLHSGFPGGNTSLHLQRILFVFPQLISYFKEKNTKCYLWETALT